MLDGIDKVHADGSVSGGAWYHALCFIQLFNFHRRNPFGVAVGFVKLDGISVER
jgi:hypothetical protein